MLHLGDLLEKVHTFESLGIRDYRLLWMSQLNRVNRKGMDQTIIHTSNRDPFIRNVPVEIKVDIG